MCQLMTIVLMFIILFSLVCGECLGDDDAGLDEICTDVMVVFAFEHLEGVTFTRCYRDNQRLAASRGFVLQDGMFDRFEGGRYRNR